MKKTISALLIGLHILTIGGVSFAIYLAMQSQDEVKEAIGLMQETKSSLSTTIAFMDEMAAVKKQEEALLQPLVAGAPAPGFTLPGHNQQDVSLSDYAGKNVLLVFSQVGCGYCDSYYPELKNYTEQYPETEVVVLQYGSTPEENRSFMASAGLSSATFVTPTTEVLASYKIQKTPTTVLIGKKGEILGSENVVTFDDLVSFVSNASTVAIAE